MPLSLVSERPTVAFVLSLIAGICYLVVGILFALAGAVVGGVPGSLVPGLGAVFLVILSIGLVSGVLMVVGAVVMRSTDRSRVRTGSVLVLIFTLVGLLFTAGGLIVASREGCTYGSCTYGFCTFRGFPTRPVTPESAAGAPRGKPHSISVQPWPQCEVRASASSVMEFPNDFIGLSKSRERECDPCWKPNVDWLR